MSSKSISNFLRSVINSKYEGNGSMYVLFILGTAMAGAFALTGGLTPQLNPAPKATDQVIIDEESANRSSEKSLQLVDIRVKPSPTPTFTPTPTRTPTVTPTPVACLNRTAILVLADLSASMQFDNKMVELRRALRLLRDKLQPETGIGLYAFGSYTDFSYGSKRGVREIVALNKYRDNKDTFDPAVNGLSEGGLGGTYMRPGFEVAIDRINRAQERTSYFRDYNYVTIVFSDGVPERSGADSLADRNLGACAPARQTTSGLYQKCFAQELDPRTDLTTQLKSEGKVYSVVVYDTRSGEDDSYFVSPVDPNDRLRTLMKAVATRSSGSTSTYYDVEVRGVNRLSNIFQSIVEGICTT